MQVEQIEGILRKTIRVIFQNYSTWNFLSEAQNLVVGYRQLLFSGLYFKHLKEMEMLTLPQSDPVVSITSGCIFHEQAEGTKTPV